MSWCSMDETACDGRFIFRGMAARNGCLRRATGLKGALATGRTQAVPAAGRLALDSGAIKRQPEEGEQGALDKPLAIDCPRLP